MRERTRLDESIKSVMAVERELADNLDMIEMAEAEGDDDIVAESQAVISRLFSEAERMEVETLLSGEADSTASTSRPAMVICATNSSVEIEGFTD